MEAKSFYANIWIGGDYDDAVRACRSFCMDVPLCVTVTKTAFVYVGGMEDGVCVRIMQYPRFVEHEENLREIARNLAKTLRDALCQRSYSIEMADTTFWESLMVER